MARIIVPESEGCASLKRQIGSDVAMQTVYCQTDELQSFYPVKEMIDWLNEQIGEYEGEFCSDCENAEYLRGKVNALLEVVEYLESRYAIA